MTVEGGEVFALKVPLADADAILAGKVYSREHETDAAGDVVGVGGLITSFDFLVQISSGFLS